MSTRELRRIRRWADFRFSVIGGLLSSPPEKGETKGAIEALAKKSWIHPIKGTPFSISFHAIERWYYLARNDKDPVKVLQKQKRKDSGAHPSLLGEHKDKLRGLYEEHPSWTMKLHKDNLAVLFPDACPSYDTVRRYLKGVGWIQKNKTRNSDRKTAQEIAEHFESREVRSYEVSYASELWHLDFHDGSKKIVTAAGKWVTPHAMCILDDYSRLCCHVQWYLSETAEDLIHAVVQAILKRGLPRGILSDNGSAMTAAEYVEGLGRLGMNYFTTLPYSPFQNGKQEFFWSRLEGRAIAMLENVERLDLKTLNDATQAWAEQEYNQDVNSEIKSTPYQRFVGGKSVGRPSPSPDELRRSFLMEADRKQRHSDGTISLEGRRFEIPGQYKNLSIITVRFARWDLSDVYMVNTETGAFITRLFPVDKHLNANRQRRFTGTPEALASNEPKPERKNEMAPLLKKLIADYSATGLPPAYLPKPEPKTEDTVK